MLKKLARPFRQAAVGHNGFEFCRGDKVLAEIDLETGDKPTALVPVTVKDLSINALGENCALVTGAYEDGTPVETVVYYENIYDPEKYEQDSAFVPDNAKIYPPKEQFPSTEKALFRIPFV